MAISYTIDNSNDGMISKVETQIANDGMDVSVSTGNNRHLVTTVTSRISGEEAIALAYHILREYGVDGDINNNGFIGKVVQIPASMMHGLYLTLKGVPEDFVPGPEEAKQKMKKARDFIIDWGRKRTIDIYGDAEPETTQVNTTSNFASEAKPITNSRLVPPLEKNVPLYDVVTTVMTDGEIKHSVNYKWPFIFPSSESEYLTGNDAKAVFQNLVENMPRISGIVSETKAAGYFIGGPNLHIAFYNCREELAVATFAAEHECIAWLDDRRQMPEPIAKYLTGYQASRIYADLKDTDENFQMSEDHKTCGYFRVYIPEGGYVVFDNRDGNLRTEQLNSGSECIKWLNDWSRFLYGAKLEEQEPATDERGYMIGECADFFYHFLIRLSGEERKKPYSLKAGYFSDKLTAGKMFAFDNRTGVLGSGYFDNAIGCIEWLASNYAMDGDEKSGPVTKD